MKKANGIYEREDVIADQVATLNKQYELLGRTTVGKVVSDPPNPPRRNYTYYAYQLYEKAGDEYAYMYMSLGKFEVATAALELLSRYLERESTPAKETE